MKKAGNTNPSEPSDSAADATAREISAPVAIPPSFGNGDPYAPQDTGGSGQSSIPGLQPMKGVNVETLFAEKLKDPDDRFARLESTVLEMRKEMNNVMPSIIRLVAIESDIQVLTKELDNLLSEAPPSSEASQPLNLTAEDSGGGNEAQLSVSQLNPQPEPPDEEPVQAIPQVGEQTGAAPPPQAKPAPPSPPQTGQFLVPPAGVKPLSAAEQPANPPIKPAPPPAAAKKPAAPPKSSEKNAMNLRLGEYKDKVRIVIDTTQKPNVTADYDPEENLVVLEISDAKWVDAAQKTFASSKLVLSYSVSERPDGKGATIAVTLKKGSKILKQGTVEPDENPNYRFYLDMTL